MSTSELQNGLIELTADIVSATSATNSLGAKRCRPLSVKSSQNHFRALATGVVSTL